MDPMIIVAIVAAVGGAPGLKICWDWYSNRNKKIRFVSTSAEFSVGNQLVVIAKVQLLNEKESQSSITDILGLIQEESASPNPELVYSSRPRIEGNSLPIQLEGKSSIMLNLIFRFNQTDIEKLNRMLVPMFIGHMQSDIPVIIADERDLTNKKDQMPLHFNILINLDGEKDVNIQRDIPAFARGKGDMAKGSLTSIDIMKIKRDFKKTGKLIAID